MHVTDAASSDESSAPVPTGESNIKANGAGEIDLTTLPEIPSETQYLIIGAGTAAFGAFRAIKSRDPKAKVGHHFLPLIQIFLLLFYCLW